MAEKKKKKKSRLKKILKTIGKIALAGGAAYGASKLFGGRKGAVSTVGQPTGTDRAAYKPSHLGEGVAGHYKDAIMRGDAGVKSARLDYDTAPIPKHHQQMQWGSIYKKGGRVTGIAKRGFGRALMKGKK